MKSDVVIEVINGKRTGLAIIFFADEKTALNAKELYHKKKIG